MIPAFRSEWLKLWSPGVLLSGGLMLGFAILGVVLGMARGGGGELSALTLSREDGFITVMARAPTFLGIVAVGIVAYSMAQEFTNGTLRNLLVREPRRLHLMAGKALGLASFVAAAVVLAVTVAF